MLKPKRTFQSVVKELVEGLEGGTVTAEAMPAQPADGQPSVAPSAKDLQPASGPPGNGNGQLERRPELG